jgi:hypothetical protein
LSIHCQANQQYGEGNEGLNELVHDVWHKCPQASRRFQRRNEIFCKR